MHQKYPVWSVARFQENQIVFLHTILHFPFDHATEVILHLPLLPEVLSVHNDAKQLSMQLIVLLPHTAVHQLKVRVLFLPFVMPDLQLRAIPEDRVQGLRYLQGPVQVLRPLGWQVFAVVTHVVASSCMEWAIA